MAQNADEGIEYQTQGGRSGSPTPTATGLSRTLPQAFLSWMVEQPCRMDRSVIQHCISLSSTEAEIVA
eukprot:2362631-Pleurochrysis_carterae.AAC.1